MKSLDFIGRPEYQAVFARLLYYAPQHPEGDSICSTRRWRS